MWRTEVTTAICSAACHIFPSIWTKNRDVDGWFGVVVLKFLGGTEATRIFEFMDTSVFCQVSRGDTDRVAEAWAYRPLELESISLRRAYSWKRACTKTKREGLQTCDYSEAQRWAPNRSAGERYVQVNEIEAGLVALVYVSFSWRRLSFIAGAIHRHRWASLGLPIPWLIPWISNWTSDSWKSP
jgi:hypothetical protein